MADRIAQFEKMASADPSNEMAHFSLGSAYLEAGRFAEAARSFERCVELSPGMSKAYQLGGKAMVGAGWADRAVPFLESGYSIAAKRGDRMPMEAIAAILASLGRTPPAAAAATGAMEAAGAVESAGAGNFTCTRTGRPGTQMERPPFRGALGEWIRANISAETWKLWIGQGTKVINELRLDFSREQDQEVYERHMHEFLGIDAETLERIRAPRA